MGGVRVSAEEKALFLKLFNEGDCIMDIANKTGRSKSAVFRELKANGLDTTINNGVLNWIKDDEKDVIVYLYTKKLMPMGMIAQRLGHDDKSIRKVLVERGIKIASRGHAYKP